MKVGHLKFVAVYGFKKTINNLKLIRCQINIIIIKILRNFNDDLDKEIESDIEEKSDDEIK